MYSIRRSRPRPRLPKPVRNILISVLILIVLLIGAGAAYTWYMDSKTTIHPISTPAHSDDIPAFAKPVAPAANARVGVAVEVITSPVAPGSNASITVRSLAGAKCTITVSYKNVASTDSGLVPKVADEYGTASWTWTVGKTVPAGTWPVGVTCARNGMTGYVRGDLQVQP